MGDVAIISLVLVLMANHLALLITLYKPT